MRFSPENAQIDVNFLLDKEIGEIDPSEVGLQGDPENFSFHILADTQGGDPSLPSNVPTRMKIHNAFLEDSISLSNKMPERPVFSMILGDVVDSQGEKGNFQTMHRYLSRLKSPVLYELGNHESKYSSKFEPGYKMDALNNYFAAQKKMNGLTKLLYSFNLGKWHFVVWPDPLRSHFWDNHPHYFEWLEKDLEKHKNRPTIMFQHVPIHPIGISPFMSYLEPPTVRKRVMEIVTRYGNVKYVFSGHTHTMAKASFKTAFSIKGTRFINLPAAGYRPRGFGEQDYYGGPTQGIGIVNIKGEKAEVISKTVMEEEFKYPQNPPELDREKYKLWFNNKWEIKANPKLMNGSFARGLDHWAPEFVYAEDKDPSSICKPVRKDGTNALYLYNRKRGYDAPGQDRLPQTINRIAQVVQVHHFDLPPNEDWANVILNPGKDFNRREKERKFGALRIDRLVINLGVWHMNEGEEQPFGIYFTGFDLQSTNRLDSKTSQVNGSEIVKKKEEEVWWRGKHVPFTHLAGEHRYHLATTDKVLFRG